VRPVDLQPIPSSDQIQRPLDLFLIFAGANIVATTLQVGASLPGSFSLSWALLVIGGGAIVGALFTAVLAPVGPALGVPSIVATRAVLGLNGAQMLALLLFVTNFAWIALNNVIAASICVKLAGGGSEIAWAIGLGLAATLVVLGGPRVAAYTDRAAVPLLFVSGIVFTVACVRAPLPAMPAAPLAPGDLFRGFDIVAGYQVSWLLMFADYPRYVRSGRAAAAATFFGLALTALWFMPLGFLAASVARSSDPGAMVSALGLGWWGGVLVTVATLTTNFVNIYMSALAFKSLRPAISDRANIWMIGGAGAALSVLSHTWIDQFASFTLVIAGSFVPVGGMLIAHYVIARVPVRVPDLYDAAGPYGRRGGWMLPGLVAWTLGALTFYLAAPIGGTLPSLAVSVAAYAALTKLTSSGLR
jgi:NCS1 family nucleobase:cation symporter-1